MLDDYKEPNQISTSLVFDVLLILEVTDGFYVHHIILNSNGNNYQKHSDHTVDFFSLNILTDYIDIMVVNRNSISWASPFLRESNHQKLKWYNRQNKASSSSLSVISLSRFKKSRTAGIQDV